MKLSTKAKEAITLKVTSSTVSDWLVSTDGFGWLDRTFDCVGLLLLASRSVANALYSAMLNSLWSKYSTFYEEIIACEF